MRCSHIHTHKECVLVLNTDEYRINEGITETKVTCIASICLTRNLICMPIAISFDCREFVEIICILSKCHLTWIFQSKDIKMRFFFRKNPNYWIRYLCYSNWIRHSTLPLNTSKSSLANELIGDNERQTPSFTYFLKKNNNKMSYYWQSKWDKIFTYSIHINRAYSKRHRFEWDEWRQPLQTHHIREYRRFGEWVAEWAADFISNGIVYR